MRRNPNPDAGLAARARALGIEAQPTGAGLWLVNGVTMTRHALIGNVQRAERGQHAFQSFTTPEIDGRRAAALDRAWAAAQKIGATLTLHPNGLVSLNANTPQLLQTVCANVEREVERGAQSARGNDWNLAQRALAALGWRVSRRGSYWQIEGGGGSFTSERLEKLVAEREAATQEAAE